MSKWTIVGPKENKWVLGPFVQFLILRCILSSKCLVVPWWYGQLSRSCLSSIVYNANLSQALHITAAESRENSLQLFQSCGLALNPLLITVWARGSCPARVGPQPAGELSRLPFNWSRHWGLLLDHSRPVKCPTLWSKYNSQHSTHKNPGIRQGRFFLFCEPVALETDNKGQPSTSGIMAEPLFSGVTPVWIRVIRAA